MNETPEKPPLPETFQPLIDAFNAIPQGRAIGLSVVDVALGTGVMRLPSNLALAGHPVEPLLHPGAITTLLDTVGALAVFSRLDGKRLIATLDMRVDYMRPANLAKDLLGEAECYRLGQEIAFVRGRAGEADGGRDVATFSAAYMLTDPIPEPAPCPEPSA
ncbi:MAG: PaaI family thioesterase [Magnetovibrionaceae bacterium]